MKGNLLGRSAKLAALVSAPALLVFALVAIANAQTPGEGITPAGTPITVGPPSTAQPTPAASATGGPTATPDLSIKTVVRIEVDPQTAPIERGTQFEARVMVDNVDHLAGFQFSISYDPKRLEAVKASGAANTPGVTPVLSIPGNAVDGRGLGAFLSTSARAGGLFCSGPADQDGKVSATCVTNDSPVCLGGPAGPSGSGLLGAVTFKSKGGGLTTLTLAKSELVQDDVQPPCDPNDPNFQVSLIPNRQQNADVNLGADTGGGSNTMLIVIVIVVLVIAVGAGGGGFLWYRNRQSGAGL
jgi:hypothetical protein